MTISVALIRKLDQIPPDLRDILLAVIEELEQHRQTTVTKEEFGDLKKIVADLAASVRDLAEAQKRTELRLNELAEAQKRTELRLNELAEAQKRTEEEVGALARAVKGTREQVGGLSRSLAYALENEAYRKLPVYLDKVHRLRIVERMIRTEVVDEEVNFWAKAVKDGREVRLVGESVLRLDDPSKLKALHRKVQKIGRLLGAELIPILVTHYAKPKVLQQATESGILVVQSYEWDQSL